jgi:bacterioferritin (cytochrome b1)
MLGKDEQNHVDYLNHIFDQLQKTGKLTSQRLDSIVPSREKIDPEAEKVKSLVKKDYHGVRQQMLSRALKVEIETRAFYKKMVDELPEEGRDIFARFLEIEENHITAVQFELDYVSSTGYWFDFKEFDME